MKAISASLNTPDSRYIQGKVENLKNWQWQDTLNAASSKNQSKQALCDRCDPAGSVPNTEKLTKANRVDVKNLYSHPPLPECYDLAFWNISRSAPKPTRKSNCETDEYSHWRILKEDGEKYHTTRRVNTQSDTKQEEDKLLPPLFPW